MQRIEMIRSKKKVVTYVIAAIVIVLATAGLGGFVLFKGYCGSSRKSSAMGLLSEVGNKQAVSTLKKVGAKKELIRLDKNASIVYPKINSQNVDSLFEIENIIPVRFHMTKNLSERAPLYLYENNMVETLNKSEKAVYVENSRRIRNYLEPVFIKNTNKNKSVEKEIMINKIEDAIDRMCVNTLTIDKKSFYSVESIEMLWPTIFYSGRFIVPWLMNNISVEELTELMKEVSILEKKHNEKKSTVRDLCVFIEKIIKKISEKVPGFGYESTVREKVYSVLKQYKEQNPIIKTSVNAYDTETLLITLDMLTYLMNVLPEDQDRYLKIVSGINTTILNISQCKEKKTLPEYLSIMNAYNQEIIKEINIYLCFVADLEQYVHVKLSSLKYKDAKYINAANNSSYIYSIEENTPVAELKKFIGGEVLEKYKNVLISYFDLLNQCEENLEVQYGFTNPAEIQAYLDKQKKEELKEKNIEQKEKSIAAPNAKNDKKPAEVPAQKKNN